MPIDALAQTLSALRKVQASSQDNFGPVAGNTSEPPDMFVPPPFTPLGMKASVGALIKSSSTVLTKRVETQMETDEPILSTASERPNVPLPIPVKIRDYIPHSRADKACMKLWANDMLSGYPGGQAIHMSHSSRQLWTQ